jgi:hypothetical protein
MKLLLRLLPLRCPQRRFVLTKRDGNIEEVAWRMLSKRRDRIAARSRVPDHHNRLLASTAWASVVSAGRFSCTLHSRIKLETARGARSQCGARGCAAFLYPEEESDHHSR